MTIRIKKDIRTDQRIVFIFVRKLFKGVELRDKINVIEYSRVITKKNNVSVKFAKKTAC